MAIGILGTGSYLPPRVTSNSELVRHLDTSDEWIVSHTGIRNRRYADASTPTSELAAHAARGALTDAGMDAGGVGGVIVATSSPDWIQPATACAVQHGLELGPVPAFDVSAACAGFTYALAVAGGLLSTDPTYGPMLVVGAEKISNFMDFEDRRTAVFFGDGAGAVILGEVPDGYGILASQLLADGQHTHIVNVPAGGTRRQTSSESVANREHFVRMDGRAVWDFAVQALPEVIEGALAKADLSLDEVDLVIFHQANAVMIRACLDALGVDEARTHLTLDRYGNTAAASIPITLHEARTLGRLRRGDRLVLASVGAGMTAGAVVLRWY